MIYINNKDEVEVVKKSAFIDVNILLKNVTWGLNSSVSENCKFAKYLVYLLGCGSSSQGQLLMMTIFMGFFELEVFGKKVRQIGRGATTIVYEVVRLGIPIAKKTFYGQEN